MGAEAPGELGPGHGAGSGQGRCVQPELPPTCCPHVSTCPAGKGRLRGAPRKDRLGPVFPRDLGLRPAHRWTCCVPAERQHRPGRRAPRLRGSRCPEPQSRVGGDSRRGGRKKAADCGGAGWAPATSSSVPVCGGHAGMKMPGRVTGLSSSSLRGPVCCDGQRGGGGGLRVREEQSDLGPPLGSRPVCSHLSGVAVAAAARCLLFRLCPPCPVDRITLRLDSDGRWVTI